MAKFLMSTPETTETEMEYYLHRKGWYYFRTQDYKEKLIIKNDLKLKDFPLKYGDKYKIAMSF